VNLRNYVTRPGRDVDQIDCNCISPITFLSHVLIQYDNDKSLRSRISNLLKWTAATFGTSGRRPRELHVSWKEQVMVLLVFIRSESSDTLLLFI
jgi:hypothetical protein